MGLTKIIGGMLNIGTPTEGDVLSFIGNAWIPKKVSGVPAGAMMSFAGNAAPEGWLLCHGQAIDRATYASLFTVLGTAYGNGNGTTTFNLPDLRGRTPIGMDNMGGASANRITDTAADVLGGHGGLESRTPTGSISGSTGSTSLSISQIPVHGHPQTWKTSWNNTLSPMMKGTDGGVGCVNAQVGTANGGLSSCGYAGNESNMVFTQDQGGSTSHNHSLSSSFSGSALEVTQPWLAVNTIIKRNTKETTMENRFKLTADDTIHIDYNGETYTETKANALLDIAAAGITITQPDLASVSGAITVVGLEVSDLKKDFILDNGWHYPIPGHLVGGYQQYVDCIAQVGAINMAKSTRLGEGEALPVEGEGQPTTP